MNERDDSPVRFETAEFSVKTNSRILEIKGEEVTLTKGNETNIAHYWKLFEVNGQYDTSASEIGTIDCYISADGSREAFLEPQVVEEDVNSLTVDDRGSFGDSILALNDFYSQFLKDSINPSIGRVTIETRNIDIRKHLLQRLDLDEARDVITLEWADLIKRVNPPIVEFRQPSKENENSGAA